MQQIRLDSLFDPPYANYPPSAQRLPQQQPQQQPQPQPPPQLAVRQPVQAAAVSDGVTAMSFHLGMSKMEEEISQLRKKLKKKTKEFERRKSKRGRSQKQPCSSAVTALPAAICTLFYGPLLWAGMFVVALVILIMVIVHMVKTEASMSALGRDNDTMRLWLQTFSIPKQ